MRLTLSILLALTTQLLVGTLIFCAVSRLLAWRGARRRWRAAWGSSVRSLTGVAPFAAAIAALTGGVAAFTIGIPPIRRIWDPSWIMTLAAAMPSAGCLALLAAARQEARGRFMRARRQARLAGELLFAGTVLLMVVIWSGLLFQVPLRRALVTQTDSAGLLLLGGMVALICAGFIAVLGGLAGKPRPAAWFAALFYLVASVGWIAAFQQTL